MEFLTKWRPNRKYRKLSDEEKAAKREKYGIIAVGNSIPSLIKSFRSMRLPKQIIKVLKESKIKKPFPLQMQGLPVLLSGRDCLLLSISREGKTLVFLLPLIIGAIEEESRLCFVENEGPVGLIIAPSRELAYQIYRFAKDFISKIEGLPQIRLALCTGGVDMQKQLNSLNQGVHIVISTPGRLSDMLGKQKLDLKLCKILILDEADRLLDQGFDEEVRAVLSHTSNVQIVLSSSTIPKRMQEFGTNFMKNPVFVSCHKYSLKKLKISQFCDLVNIEGKMIKLLDVLQKKRKRLDF